MIENNPTTAFESQDLQRRHYDNLVDSYESHYGERYSEVYRRRFIYEYLFKGIDLHGLRVLEAMSGSGQATGYLMENGASVTGLDISQKAITLFKAKWPAAGTLCSSILDSSLPEEAFDCVVVVGGLHHLHPNVMGAIQEIHRILKPNGYFCFCEPHQGSLPDLVRNFWYRHDGLFEVNEAAVDLTFLKNENANRFEFIREKYLGNIGYLLVLNSMVFRIPLWLKPLYSPALLSVEGAIAKLQSKRTSCFVVCQWKKK